MAWIGANANRGSRSGAQTFPGARVAWQANDEVVRAFLQRVYWLMSLGLATTGIIAFAVASSPAAMALLLGHPLLFYGLLAADLVMVLAFAPVAARAGTAAASVMFFGYAALSGVTFSVIFLRYTLGSIGATFIVTGGMFAALSAYGALTKRDLSSVGSFCMMGLTGLVIGSIVNLFLGSALISWMTTFVGIIVFTGLTAYDTSKLKQMAAQADGAESRAKGAVQGALVLYLDFVNLFLDLLRLLGNRRRD